MYAADGVTVIATQFTDEAGRYFFGDLAAGTYIVQVLTNSMSYSGLTNFVDPDGGSDNTSSVTITTGQINLNQDFGYRDQSNPNTLSGTLWNDLDADGTLDAGETGRFPYVRVLLRDTNNQIVGITITDGSGNYSFTNLPDGDYKVDVADWHNAIPDYWKSTGPNPGVDNNSQVEPYIISLSGGENNTTGDFGYYDLHLQ